MEKVPWYKPEDFPEPPPAEVWGENWEPLWLFIENMTQWRVGQGGPTGLDYNVFHAILNRKNLTSEQFDQFMRDIGICERVALRMIHQKR